MWQVDFAETNDVLTGHLLTTIFGQDRPALSAHFEWQPCIPYAINPISLEANQS